MLRWICIAAVACHSPSDFHEPSELELATDMAEAARRFLGSLSEPELAKVRFGFDHPERLNWHYIPRDRHGLPIGELAAAQRHLADGFLATALDRRGLIKATGIMALEEVLRERELGSGTFVRDPGAYYLSVFGQPSTSETWGWRLEGHHLSLNLTLVGGTQPVAAPVFLGASPSPAIGILAGTRVLGREEQLGLELVASLDADQRRAAIYNAAAPEDVLLGPGAETRDLPGLVANRMTEAQRAMLAALVDEALASLPRELADRERAKLAGAITEIVFTWAGAPTATAPHYFRVAGPTFIYELDNTQEGATHVHTGFHARGDDFGADALREHVRLDHRGGQ